MDELEQITRRYLLGELSEQEQAALEKEYFSDPQVFNQVLRVESELVDAYARGQLSAEMRERFENSYLKHPSRRERVEFARALTTRIDEQEASVTRAEKSPQPALHSFWKQRLLATVGGQRPALRFAIALIIVLVALAGIWILVDSRRRQQQREGEEIQAQRENQERREREQRAAQQPTETPQQKENKQVQEERAAETPPETPQLSPNPIKTSAPSTVSLALAVGGVRGANGGPTQTLVILPETTQAQISLNLKDDSYPGYRVSLQKIDGPEIFTQTNIRPRRTKAGARFVFTVPVRQLTSGDYTLTLGGITPEGQIDDLNKSLFRVKKR